MVLLITCPAFISMHTSIAMKNKRKSQFLMEIIYNDEKRNSKTEFILRDEDDGFCCVVPHHVMGGPPH
jgi:hypothetical protein